MRKSNSEEASFAGIYIALYRSRKQLGKRIKPNQSAAKTPTFRLGTTIHLVKRASALRGGRHVVCQSMDTRRLGNKKSRSPSHERHTLADHLTHSGECEAEGNQQGETH